MAEACDRCGEVYDLNELRATKMRSLVCDRCYEDYEDYEDFEEHA